MLARWKVRRLSAFFTAVMLALLALLMLSVRTLLRASEERERIVRTSSDDRALVDQVLLDAEQMTADLDTSRERDPDLLLTRQRAARAAFNHALETLVDRASTVEGRMLLAKIGQDARAYEAALDLAESMRERPLESTETHHAVEARLPAAREALDASLARFIAHEVELIDGVYRATRSSTRRATTLIIGIGTVALVASSTLGWRLTRTLTECEQHEHAALGREHDATATRDEVLRIISHDLRSPLGAVLLKATTIRTGAAPDAAKQAQAIEEIVMRMDRLVKGLLDLTAIETGRFVLRQERCEAGDLVATTEHVVGAAAATKSIRLDVDPSARDVVLADRERVAHVLSILVDNAIKFTAEQGLVTVSASRVGADVRFFVKDTGCGIAPEHLPHVFERSWKAEVGGKTGGGLGLYIAKRIVEAHGGTVGVESTPGAGSSFFFRLQAVS
jgi:signal transduction histidine kinase